MGVRPHCLEPVVEAYSAKAAMYELYKGAATWFLQLQTLQDDVMDAAYASTNRELGN